MVDTIMLEQTGVNPGELLQNMVSDRGCLCLPHIHQVVKQTCEILPKYSKDKTW